MISFLFIAAVSLVLILALYFLVHWRWPTFGTLVTNALVGLPAFALQIMDGLQQLPWAHVLVPEKVGAVLFALAIANMVMRLRGAKKPVGAA